MCCFLWLRYGFVSVFRRPNGMNGGHSAFYQVYGRNSKTKKIKMAYGYFDSERTIDRVIHIFGALILASIRFDSLPCFRLKIVLWMCDFRCTHLTRKDTKRVRRAHHGHWKSETERAIEPIKNIFVLLSFQIIDRLALWTGFVSGWDRPKASAQQNTQK